MPRIFDNQELSLGPALQETLGQAVALDACVGYLNLRGWKQLAPAVDALEGMSDRQAARVLVGMAARPDQVVRDTYRIRRPEEDTRVTVRDARRFHEEVLTDFRRQLTVGAPSVAQEQQLQAFREQLASGTVCVKFFARYPLHAKLYLAYLKTGQVIPRLGFLGSSNLTFSGLVRQGELNIDVPDHVDTETLCEWFKARWEDDFAIDVTQDLIDILDESWVSPEQPDPYLVFLKLAFELSSDARDGLREYDVPLSLRNVLLRHQAEAVSVAARIVQRRGGVMIGDVVGLGKTLTATAIARVLQEQIGIETLVICPKNLVQMWKDHIHTYQLYGDVMSLSVAHRDLPDLARYRLVVIDESHNLRNPQTQQWQAVRGYIERNDPNVVLLTATPYNKAYSDAAGQLRLWIGEDEDLGVRPEQIIESEGELYVASRADGRLSTIKAFETSPYPADWQRLMSLFLVRRTRRYIEQRFAEQDEHGRRFLRFADGTPFYFPKRVPIPLEYRGGVDDPGDRLASTATVDELAKLQLPRYRLGAYVRDGLAGSNAAENDALARIERSRGNLQGFIRASLMKRLSSCGASFLISIERHLLRNHLALHALHNGEPVPIGTIDDARIGADDDRDEEVLEGFETVDDTAIGRDADTWASIAAERYAALAAQPPPSLHWLDPGFFDDRLAADIEGDCEILQSLLDAHGVWNPDCDSKIDALAGLISDRHRDEKVLVFSEYADTARYVGRTLERRLPDLQIASVTGDDTAPTVAARRFSPRSNESLGGLPTGQLELQVLVATDVLSEGQNLQDGAVVINYDLPWTIIRLIQRAGRVDRVGQRSPEVSVYSFLPQDGVSAVIDLRDRIRRRLRENAAVFGSDEQFFEEGLSNEDVRGIFDGTTSLDGADTEEDVDWSSQALAIWQAATDEQRASAAALPPVTYSTRPRRNEDNGGGVLVYTRTTRGIDGLAWAESDPTGNAQARVITPFEALRVGACEPADDPPERRPDHHDLVGHAVSHVLIESARQPLAITHSGIRRRVYRILDEYRRRNEGTLLDTPALRNLVEAVLVTPLRETAKQRLSRAIRQRPPDDVVALAMELDEEGSLLVDVDDGEDDVYIVCSLGVKDAE